MLTPTIRSSSTQACGIAPPNSPTAEANSRVPWSAAFTRRFIDQIEPFRNAVQRLFIDNLSFTGRILEVGAGPQGGATYYLPRELHSFFTLTEPAATENPRIRQIAASNLPEHFGKVFNTIVAANVMDCILERGSAAGREALMGMKAVLKPGGEIKLFHYFGATGAFVGAAIMERRQRYVVFPYEKNLKYPFTAISPALMFADRSLLEEPLDPRDRNSTSLKSVVDRCYPREKQFVFYNLPSSTFLGMEKDEESAVAASREVCAMVHKVGLDVFRIKYNAYVRTIDDLLADRIQELASACSMTCNIEFKKACATPPDQQLGSRWFEGHVSPSPDPNVQQLFCMVITLREAQV